MTENYDINKIEEKANQLAQAYLKMCRLMDTIEDCEELNDMYFDNELLEVVPETLIQLRKKVEAWNAQAAIAYTNRKEEEPVTEPLFYDEKDLVETTDEDFELLGLADKDIHPAYKLDIEGKTFWFDFRGKPMDIFNK